jgi:2'-5' RNA ligase
MSEHAAAPAFTRQLGFRLVWLAGSTRLRLSAGKLNHVLPPSGADAAVHYALIIRVPPNVAAAVAPTLERLRGHDPHHRFYPPATMHVTLLKLDGFLPDGSDAAARTAELRDTVASHPSFDLIMGGLNLSSHTVFAQIFPYDHTFRSLRRHLGKVTSRGAPRSPGARIVDVFVRDLAHTNVVRFSGPVTKGFIEEVSLFRRVRFGRWTVREVELVRSDKLLSWEGTQIIERMPLATS